MMSKTALFPLAAVSVQHFQSLFLEYLGTNWSHSGSTQRRNSCYGSQALMNSLSTLCSELWL